jgi:hypothetical protein
MSETEITKSARGKDCEVLFPGYQHRRDTVVHCHYPIGGVTSGMGFKSHDLLGARACYDCHRILDNRDLTAEEREIDRDWVKDRFRLGIVRTIAQLVKEGLV